MYSTFISHLTDVEGVYFFPIFLSQIVANSNLCMCVWLDLHISISVSLYVIHPTVPDSKSIRKDGKLLFVLRLFAVHVSNQLKRYDWLMNCAPQEQKKIGNYSLKVCISNRALFAPKIRAWVEMTKRERARKARRCAKQQRNRVSRKQTARAMEHSLTCQQFSYLNITLHVRRYVNNRDIL